jgi:hypothetical protein
VHVFLLSPAYCGGRRAKMLLNPASDMRLARDLREGRLSLGAAFTFMSGLYFRGKLAYARTFSSPHAPPHVITPTRGLMSPDTLVTAELLQEFATEDVDVEASRYRRALEFDAAELADRLPADTGLVLLGSVATGKYADVLEPFFVGRLYFPAAFVGRGDMSRGGLMLRSSRSGVELEYAAMAPGQRPRGPRPPKLDARSKAGSR